MYYRQLKGLEKFKRINSHPQQQQESRQERIFHTYIQDVGDIRVIASCHGGIPCTVETEEEFRTISRHIIGVKVMGTLYAGKDGVETFYKCKQDESVYVLKTYHEPQQIVTIFGKLIVEES